jgi:hypothetical protein
MRNKQIAKASHHNFHCLRDCDNYWWLKATVMMREKVVEIKFW